MAPSGTPEHLTGTVYDLVIIGAGIVGLAHAWHGVRAGLRVHVVERDEFAVGASIRNFGHIGTTAQSGRALEFALAAREDWLQVAQAAGTPITQAGTVVLARTVAELAVLEEFRAERGDQAVLLTAEETAQRLGFDAPGAVGGAHLALDLRVDPPHALPALVSYLQTLGVTFSYATNVGSIQEGKLQTSRGLIRAAAIVVAVGHDIDRLFPQLAATQQIDRCRLRMLEIDTPRGIRIGPAILTGLGLLRYDGFASQPSAAAVRSDFERLRPQLIEQQVNLMFTQRPDGRLIVGDTHHFSVTETPFEDEASDDLLLEETRCLFGVDSVTVRRRWRGVYAAGRGDVFVQEQPIPGVWVATVASGIGMTTAFGFAANTISQLISTPLQQPIDAARLPIRP